MKLATIDIGTHSVLLLILKKQASGKLNKLADEATLTRIGEGLGTADRFGIAGMERTLAVLKHYRGLCDRHGAVKILAVGTAAFRKAQNAGEFVQRVGKECGIPIEIISGEREAALTWKAASTDFGENIVVVDVGGGSTEIILGEKQEAEKQRGREWKAVSLPVGSVILTEKYCHSDPISDADYQKMCTTIENQLSALSARRMTHDAQRLIATAGTATTLGAIRKKMKVYKHDEIHGLKISLAEIRAIIADLRAKTIAERKKIPGLEPGRADVILAGATLVEKTAQHFGFQKITVSDRGVRWGLVYEHFQ